ncbi:hypothetical protein ACFLSF_01890 [Candidatus Bipolaricaulota bacterium]
MLTKRTRGLGIVVLIATMAMSFGCSRNSGVEAGMYVNVANSWGYIELSDRGQCRINESGTGYDGTYTVRGDTITLDFSEWGFSLEARIEGETLIDEHGRTWRRE